MADPTEMLGTPLLGPNSFIFMQFSAKNLPIHPHPGELALSPLGNPGSATDTVALYRSFSKIFYCRCVSQIRQMCVHSRRYKHFEVPNAMQAFSSISPGDRHSWVNENRDAFVRSLVDNPSMVNRDDLSALLVDMLLQIVGHPAFVIENDPVQNELACLELFRNKVESFSETDRREWIPQILWAVHLPVIGEEHSLRYKKNSTSGAPVLDLILRDSHNIPKLDELLWLAVNENNNVHGTLEWFLERFCNSAALDVRTINLRCSFGSGKNAVVNNVSSKQVLIKGFRICVCATPSFFGRRYRQYYVVCQDVVRGRRQPYKHVVEIQRKSGGWTPVKTYHDGVVDEHAVDDMHEHIMDDDQTFHVRVRRE